MKKIAIYARYSSDLQSEKSVDDQVSECKRYIDNTLSSDEQFEIALYIDKAISGRSIINRSAYIELQKHIEQQKFDFLISDTLDRLGRNLGDLSNLYKICEYYKVKIFTIQDGKITLLHIGFKGTMSDMFIDNLSHQVRRSQRSGAEQGKMFGLPYGYRIKIKDGREARGERVINEDQSKVILSIFQMYAGGHSLGSIVQVLNARDIPSPRKSKWTKQSLFGSLKRREGILNNEIYRGKVIWNMRSKYINPKTNGINYFMNPEHKWVITQKDELRIISDELWIRCDYRKWPKKNIGKHKSPRKRLVNPLRSLIYCGLCNGRKTLADRKRYVCTASRRNKTCSNGRGTQFDKIITSVFDELFYKLDLLNKNSLHLQINKILLKKSEINNISTEIQEKSNKISNLIKVIEMQNFDVEELSERLGELQLDRMNLIKKRDDFNRKNKNDNILPFLKNALLQLKNNLVKTQKSDSCAIELELLIEKIILKPTLAPSGETINIKMQPNAWLDYYRFLENQKPERSN